MADIRIVMRDGLSLNLERFNKGILAVLIMPPHIEFVRKYMLPQIEYLSARSGADFTMLLIGYSPDSHLISPNLNNLDKQFNNELFSEHLKDLEKLTSWHYSGAAEMLLVNMAGSDTRIKEYIAVPIEELAEKFGERFVRSVFEAVIRNAESAELKQLLQGSIKTVGKQKATDILSLLLPAEYRKYTTLGKMIKVTCDTDYTGISEALQTKF